MTHHLGGRPGKPRGPGTAAGRDDPTQRRAQGPAGAHPARTAVGIDCGATHLRAAVVAESGSVLHHVRMAVPRDLPDRVAAPVEVAARLCHGVRSVGLAVAGTVVDGTLTWSAHLGLSDVPFADLVMQRTGLPAVVVNDARAAGYAEAMVGAAGARGVTLYVSVGSGIGGAVIIDGRPVAGAGDAGEIGHISIDPRGPLCTCGRRGCWELMAGGRALDQAARGLAGRESLAGSTGTPPTARDLVRAAERGDESARRAISRAVSAFASGLDSVCAVLSPDLVVLGGGIMSRGGLLGEQYRAATAGLRWLRAPIALASLGDDAGAIGAALLSLQTQRVAGD